MKIARKSRQEGVAVMLSPLIDCVFLLLIFFLVTSMIKRSERQIPIRLGAPEATVSIDIDDPAFRMRVDEAGGVYEETGRDRFGATEYTPMDQPLERLAALLAEEGTETPIELVVDRETPFQTVIRVLDELELLGFERVSSRIYNVR